MKPTQEPYGQAAMMEVEKPSKKPPVWVDCKICGMGCVNDADSKGLCHDCRRWRSFFKAMIDRIIANDAKLDEIVKLLKEKA